jgi:hypothetical protein
VPELKALALTLSETFHRGQLLHSTGTFVTNDLINWTSESTEPREIRVLSILLPDLTDTAELLELSNTGDDSSLVDRNLLITAGPWKKTNKTIAWETFLEREGLPTHASCSTKNCRNKDPIIISQGHAKRWDDHPKSIKAALEPHQEKPLDTISHHSSRTYQQDNRMGNLPRKRRPPHARVLLNKKLPEQGPYHHLSGTCQALG